MNTNKYRELGEFLSVLAIIWLFWGVNARREEQQQKIAKLDKEVEFLTSEWLDMPAKKQSINIGEQNERINQHQF